MTSVGFLWRAASFLAGCGLALYFSGTHVARVLKLYAQIPTLVNANTEPLAYSCRDQECVTCTGGVLNTPGAIVFTGGSTFRYALDFDVFSKAMPRPVVNCIKNDSRVDTYRSWFAYAPVNREDQVIFHGYNSWAVNSPGTWAGDREASIFFLHPPPPPAAPPPWVPRWARPAARRLISIRSKTDLALLYAHILLTREMAGSPIQWRMALRSRFAWYEANNASVWPLSRQEHFERRIALMKRTFPLSGYVKSFIIDAYINRPADEIAARHEAFLATVEPTRRVVFFPGPELTEVFPDRVKDGMAQAKRVMLDTLAKHPSVRHVEIDYRACGVGPLDFWQDGAMYFDIPHANSAAVKKLTTCIADALKTSDLVQPLFVP